jgi:hypothetical protein
MRGGAARKLPHGAPHGMGRQKLKIRQASVRLLIGANEVTGPKWPENDS